MTGLQAVHLALEFGKTSVQMPLANEEVTKDLIVPKERQDQGEVEETTPKERETEDFEEEEEEMEEVY